DPDLSLTTGFRFLVLDRAIVGSLKSVNGGDAIGDVVLEDPDSSGVVRKHLGTVNYEPIVMRFGMSMAKPVYDWMSAVLSRKPQVPSGSILATDSEHNLKSALDFSSALMTGITFPALDAASNAEAFFTVTLAPESTKLRPARGTVPSPKLQKLWLAARFAFTLGTLPTNRVSRIEALTVEQPAAG